LLDEVTDDRRQRIARLGVGSGDGQGAFLLVGEFLGDLLDAFDLTQDLTRRRDNPLSGGCHAGQMLATARKDFHSQLVFKQTDLLADPRL
jgi:hypothetical protein